MKVLIIDNFDSFTYNLYQYIGEILREQVDSHFRKNDVIDVYRNNEISVEKIRKKKYDRIIISPGPGDPSDTLYFGVCSDVILHLGKQIPVLGVCLGMQGIGYCFGGKITRAKAPMHGKKSAIAHDGRGVFHNISQNIEVMRYHSLIIKKETLPSCLTITAESIDTKEIMGLRHKEFPIEGIQFHPESFATDGGKQMLRNFLFRNLYSNI